MCTDVAKYISVKIDSNKILFLLDKNVLGWLEFKGISNTDLINEFEKNYKNIYLLHNFFIVPELRSKGYGKKIFRYTLNYLKILNAEKFFLIPEPYEIEILNNKEFEKKLTDEEKNKRLEKLINFYSSFGFDFLNDETEAELLLKAFNFQGKSYRLMHIYY